MSGEGRAGWKGRAGDVDREDQTVGQAERRESENFGDGDMALESAVPEGVHPAKNGDVSHCERAAGKKLTSTQSRRWSGSGRLLAH